MLWSKGVADFVEAARIIKPRHPSASFVLFGGSTEDYGSKNPDFIPKAWLEDLNREGVVAWQGFTDPALVERAMRSAGAVVLPSRAEGMPRTLIEAAAAGVPIITTDTPGCHDTVVPGRSGYVCPPHPPERIAADMIELIEHPERWDAMGREARNLAVTMFDSRLIVDQMFAVYGRASASASFAFEPRQA
jgi:glycosyltransferase involved in cell wall biosynthesis